MKTLFNEYEAPNTEGQDFNREVTAAIRPIIEKYFSAGYSSRDIESQIISEVTCITAELRLTKAIKLRDIKRKPWAYKTVSEWETINCDEILDYDGFRDVQTTDVMTLEEYETRLRKCTVKLKY